GIGSKIAACGHDSISNRARTSGAQKLGWIARSILQVINTHVAYFGEQLMPLGVRIQRQTCVPDGAPIAEVLKEVFPRTDVVLITGGLGPTSDDITREIMADMLGMELEIDESIVEHIRTIFRSHGREMPETNKRQAMVPKGAEILDNPNGTAPGLYFPAAADRNPHLFVLPGPPRELKPMFEDIVRPRLEQMLADELGEAPTYRNFRILGVGESQLAEDIEQPLREVAPDIEIGYCARLGEVDLRVVARTAILDQAEDLVRSQFPDELINTDGRSLEETVVQLLIERGQWIATVESCTGGFIAHNVTNVSGSSGVFRQGFVTYANEAKTEMVGVDPQLLAEHGAVSEQVARAMAEGALERSGVDHTVAVTGIAGPTGGTPEKPVGTVFIGQASKGAETFVRRYRFKSDRPSFKIRVTRMALDLIRRRVLGLPLG
ncbi:MAG: competence/damage-inducible protein A, partial [Verrucomicrobiota bacterium]